MPLGEFLFKIRGDSTQFGASIGTATNRLNQFGGAVQSVFTRYVLPYFGARAIAQYARGTMQWADNLVDFSNKTGFTTEQLQELEHAARLTGVSLQSFAQAVRYMGLAQSQAAKGNKEFIDMFERWGMTDWRTMSPGEAMYAAMRKMKGETNISAQTFRDLQNMMGRSATELIPAMVEGIDNFAAAARESGIVIEDGIVQSLARANDEWDTLIAKAKAMGVGPLSKVLRGLQGFGAGVASSLDVLKLGAGLITADEAKKRHRERFDKVLAMWGETSIGEIVARAFGAKPGKRTTGGGMDFSNLAKATRGGGGLSGDVDQWARMGLYVTSGQMIYQRSVMTVIRQIQKDLAAVKNNTADASELMEERF